MPLLVLLALALPLARAAGLEPGAGARSGLPAGEQDGGEGAGQGDEAGPDGRARPVPRTEAFSYFARPLYLGAEPPLCASLQHVHVGVGGAEGVPAQVTHTREQAREIAVHVAALAGAGEDFAKLAERFSCAPHARTGAVMGTFPPGVLFGPMDAFVRTAELGDVSAPIESPNGFHVLKRVERFAGVRQILLKGRDEETLARAIELRRRLREGADFAVVAREHSEHPTSAEGGVYRVYERGSEDSLLKKAAFGVEVGQVVGPIESTLGYHLLQRVDPAEIPEPLHERNWVRARAILVAHDQAPGPVELAARSLVEAQQLAQSLYERITAGREDMERLAREYTDEPTARERGGSLGWIYRKNVANDPVLERVFLSRRGTVVEPIRTKWGWVILRKE